MNEISLKTAFRWVQVVLWLIFFLAWALYTNNKWNDSTYGFSSTLIGIVFYVVAVYGNSHFLMPRFFRKGNIWRYLLYALIFLCSLIAIRAYLEFIILMPLHKRFYDLKSPHLSLVFLTTLIAFLFGTLLFITKNYIGLLKKQEELKAQQLSTELNLLKQQVQPHFLFNTLNNIYSLANARSENTKIAIAKLADIMRYFMEDAPREKVLLQLELDFIRNYISLEQLRMPHPLRLNFEADEIHVEIPPMLLMPFVENLFKHGIDKTRNDNEAMIQLRVDEQKLVYTVSNKMPNSSNPGNGFGLKNLRKRLDLLYGENYKLNTAIKDFYFEAKMEIPL